MPPYYEGVYAPEKASVDKKVMQMLQYAASTFKRVNPTFFKGMKTVTNKLSKYVVKRNYYDNQDSSYFKESIKFWELKEIEKNKVAETERIVTKEPWVENLPFAKLDSKSNYLPSGTTKKDETKELIWTPGWISTNSELQTIRREISIEKVPQLLEDFYSSIGQMYGEMAHNELRNVKLTIPIEWFSNKQDYVFNLIKQRSDNCWFSEQHANSMNIPIAGNYTTATIMAHELMHRFITINDGITVENKEELRESERYKNAEKTPNFTNELILKEACPIYAEMLFADYLEEKHPNANTVDFLFKYRLIDFVLLNKVDSSYIDDLTQWVRFAKHYEENDNLTDKQKEYISSFVRSTPEWRDNIEFPELYTPDVLHRLSHVMGYMYAAYLHQRTLKGELNPQDVLNKCTEAYVLSYSDEEKQMEILEELGAPFIKDGQFVMDDEALKVLYKATTGEIERRIEKNKKSRSVNSGKKITLDDIRSAILKNKNKNKTLAENQKEL